MPSHPVRITRPVEQDLRRVARQAVAGPHSLLTELQLLARFPNAGHPLPGDLADCRVRRVLDGQWHVAWRTRPRSKESGEAKSTEVLAIVRAHPRSTDDLTEEVRRRLLAPGHLLSRPLPDTLALFPTP